MKALPLEVLKRAPVLTGFAVQRRDSDGSNRVDEKELRPEIQSEVERLWSQVTTDNLKAISDFHGFRADFSKLFGFGVTGVNYDADVDAEVPIDNLTDLTQPVADQ